MFILLKELLETLSLVGDAPTVEDLKNNAVFKEVESISSVLADDLLKKFEGDITSFKRNPDRFDSLFLLTMQSAKIVTALQGIKVADEKIKEITQNLAVFAKRKFNIKDIVGAKEISGIWAGRVSQQAREQLEEQLDDLCEKILKG